MKFFLGMLVFVIFYLYVTCYFGSLNVWNVFLVAAVRMNFFGTSTKSPTHPTPFKSQMVHPYLATEKRLNIKEI